MKKLLWISTTGRARKLQDMPRSDAAEAIEPLPGRTLSDAELELVAGGGSHIGGVTDSPSSQPGAVSITGQA
jgi:hypothetical protein